jgi:hypothetical protein
MFYKKDERFTRVEGHTIWSCGCLTRTEISSLSLSPFPNGSDMIGTGLRVPPGGTDLFITWLRLCQQHLLDRHAVSAIKYCHTRCPKEMEKGRRQEQKETGTNKERKKRKKRTRK